MAAPYSQLHTLTLPRTGQRITYEITFKRIKNINLRVHREGHISVSAPYSVPLSHVENFLCQREDWLLSALYTAAMRTEAHPDTAHLAEQDTLPYLGSRIRVIYMASPQARGRFDFDKPAGVLTVTLPDPQDTGWRQAAVEAFEKAQTKEFVTQFLHKHLPTFQARGVPSPTSVRFKSMSSRYGSCVAARGSLNFSSRLCEYPLPFIEYVVVHELCHFLHQNHSAAFYHEVEAILPDWKQRKQLADG